MVVEIPLTRGYVALVDDEDAPAVLTAGRWQVMASGRTHYARRSVEHNGVKTTVRMHNWLTGWPMVDHVNGDGLDNRRANLRPATRAQNAQNRTVRSDNASGYKGVRWDPIRERWQAAIYVNGRRFRLGGYADLAAAARAYDVAARAAFGEFARVNFPDVTA